MEILTFFPSSLHILWWILILTGIKPRFVTLEIEKFSNLITTIYQIIQSDMVQGVFCSACFLEMCLTFLNGLLILPIK